MEIELKYRQYDVNQIQFHPQATFAPDSEEKPADSRSKWFDNSQEKSEYKQDNYS